MLDPPLESGSPCDDCDPCIGLATGSTGLIYHNAAGGRSCLEFTGEAVKYLKWDANGPFWGNA